MTEHSPILDQLERLNGPIDVLALLGVVSSLLALFAYAIGAKSWWPGIAVGALMYFGIVAVALAWRQIKSIYYNDR